jgi:hypothetical protein
VVGAEESSEELARKVYEAHEAGSPDRESARKLADIYFNRDDYDNAIEYYRYLSALANETDPGLLRKISDIEVRRQARLIADKEQELAALAPGDEAVAALEAELEELKRGKAEQMGHDNPPNEVKNIVMRPKPRTELPVTQQFKNMYGRNPQNDFLDPNRQPFNQEKQSANRHEKEGDDLKHTRCAINRLRYGGPNEGDALAQQGHQDKRRQNLDRAFGKGPGHRVKTCQHQGKNTGTREKLNQMTREKNIRQGDQPMKQ